MGFLQAAMNAVDRLPVTRAAARKVVRNHANSLPREMPGDYGAELRNFKEPPSQIPKNEAHQQMLFLLHLFEYMNGQPGLSYWEQLANGVVPQTMEQASGQRVSS